MSDLYSDVKVFPVKNAVGSLLGNGSVVVAGVVELRFTVIKGPNGPFASLPAEQGKKPDENGKLPWYPRVRILDKDNYTEFQQVVAEKYQEAVKGGGKTTAPPKQQAAPRSQQQRPAPRSSAKAPEPIDDFVDEIPY